MNNKLQRGMLYVLAASIVNLIFRLFTNIVLPMYLSVNSYADIKTYQLYVSFAGIFTFGYIDGMYLHFGGKSIESIDIDELLDNLTICRTFQIAVSAVFLVVAYFFNDIIIYAFALSLFPTNLISYFHYLYQATGKFDRYAKITNLTSIFTFLINITLLFFIKTDQAVMYIWGYSIFNLVMWIALEISIHKLLKRRIRLFAFSMRILIQEIKDGILLTLGQFSSIILTGMDRWLIKILMDQIAFAQYSFAVSIVNFLTIATTPITVTLYNYFCKENNSEKIKSIRNCIIMFSVFLISSAYMGDFFLERFLRKYLEASDTLYLLFASQVFFIIIRGIYVNLYKAQKKQKLYFYKLNIVIVSGLIYNIIFYKIYPVKEAFAIGTLLASITWFALCLPDFKEIGYRWRELSYLIIEVSLFIVFGLTLNAVYGFAAYLSVSIILSVLLMRKETIFLLNIVSRLLKEKVIPMYESVVRKKHR